MPTIKRKELHEKQVSYRHESQEMTSNFYNSMAWKRLRNTYLSTHPLCEICLQHEKVEPTEHIHHRVPWQRGINEEEKWKLFLDEKNLISVCSDCHMALHNKDRQYHLGSLDSLTDTEWKYAKKLNF